MKSKVLPFVTILMVLMLSACASAISAEEQGGISGEMTSESDGEHNVVIFTPSIGPNRAAMNLGDTLVVQIPTIPEEGFNWVVKDIDTSILVQEGEGDYIEDPDEASAGGMTEFRFIAVGSGETTINMFYMHEDGEMGKDTFAVTVSVENGESKTVVVTPSPTGNSATLSVGDTLVVEIPTIPEENFQWTVKEFDPNILEQIGAAEYIEDPDAADGGGITRVEFKALSAGEMTLSLEYVNANADASEFMTKDTFSVQVVVE